MDHGAQIYYPARNLQESPLAMAANQVRKDSLIYLFENLYKFILKSTYYFLSINY